MQDSLTSDASSKMHLKLGHLGGNKFQRKSRESQEHFWILSKTQWIDFFQCSEKRFNGRMIH